MTSRWRARPSRHPTVDLKGFDDDNISQTVFDQDQPEFLPPSGSLQVFEETPSQGDWILEFELDPAAGQDATVTLERFEIRLHHLNQPPC